MELEMSISGEIKTIRYEQNDFFIFTITKPKEILKDNKYRTKFNNNLLLCKGRSVQHLKIGDILYLKGKMEISSFNGEYTFVSSKIEKSFLVTEGGFRNFLKTFKGLGDSTITKIIKKYEEDIKNAKTDFLNDIKDNDTMIKTILKENLFNKIKLQVDEIPEESLNSAENDFALEFKIPPHIIKKIKAKGMDLIEAFRKDPYELALNTKGIGYISIDKEFAKIKEKLNIDDLIYKNMKYTAGIYYTLKEAEKDGHTFYNLDNIKYYMGENKLDPISDEELSEYLNILLDKGKIFREEGRYYITENYESEKEVAEIIYKKMKLYEEDKIVDIEFEFDEGFVPSSKQKEALEKSLISPIMVLTGGPGTGKTSIAKYIYQNLKRLSPKSIIKIMAPTGTAARRISQVIGCDATTIHRGIGFRGSINTFNQANPLDADIVLVDESSMIDLKLLHNFLKAVRDDTKIIFIGDIEQLPSVGIGNCLEDMQKAGVSTIRLDRVYRQNNDNPIVDLAYDVNKKIVNYYPFMRRELKPDEKLNVIIRDSFNKKTNENANINMENATIDIFFEFLNSYDLIDIQILCQLKKGITGTTESFNKRIQSLINSNPFIEDTKFKVGDKVIQTKNNYNKNIFNGSIGFIRSYNANEDEILVEFIDGSDFIPVTFKAKNKSKEEGISNNIDLAYSITIHKSQGNEWKVVLLNLTNYFFINKKLIYTAVTRAREKVTITSNHVILSHGIKTEYGLKEINGKLVEVKRNSTLSDRILKLKAKSKEITI
jgi:exodeoxyribonuclease V alpha subunit